MKKEKTLALFLLIFFLTSCEKEQIKKEEVSSKINNNLEQKEEVKKVYNYIKKTELTKELKVYDKCIGCGKCAFIAPNNFIMNFKTYKAEVISQENIDSIEVKKSIQICPVDAIDIS